MSSVIRLGNVYKWFGNQMALNGVSLEVPRGVVFALLGENGAGKSTTIRTLLGLVTPDAGQAEVLGFNCRHDSLQIRQRVGYVSERPTLYDWMTVDEIGWFTSGFYAVGFLARYRELAKQFKLPAQKIGSLSKGMRAKVALALALAHDPEVLILDEPTSGLDTLVRREFLESMVDRAASGKTVFLSSHQIHEVERVADYVAIMRDGKILIVDRLERLKSRIVELLVTLSDGASAPPEIVGEVLRQRRRTRQWQILARDVQDEDVHALRSRSAVLSVEVRTPTLEEIFVAHMQSNSPESESPNSSESNRASAESVSH